MFLQPLSFWGDMEEFRWRRTFIFQENGAKSSPYVLQCLFVFLFGFALAVVGLFVLITKLDYFNPSKVVETRYVIFSFLTYHGVV